MPNAIIFAWKCASLIRNIGRGELALYYLLTHKGQWEFLCEEIQIQILNRKCKALELLLFLNQLHLFAV